MNKEFERSVVAIFGAAGGIGAAVADAFLERGACVLVGDTTDAGNSLSGGEPNKRRIPVDIDANDPQAAVNFFDRCEHAFGPVDVFIAAARPVGQVSVLDVGRDDMRDVIDRELLVPALFMQEAARRMVPRGHGRIIVFTSMSAKTGVHTRVGPFAAAKGGLIAFARVMAAELAAKGVTVNAIATALFEPQVADLVGSAPESTRHSGRPFWQAGGSGACRALLGLPLWRLRHRRDDESVRWPLHGLTQGAVAMALLDQPHLHNHPPGEDYSWMVEARGHRFRVHTRAYTDNAVFDAEMERIFKHTWVYVAHTSELPEPGDYRTSYIGNQPVIVSRSDDGAIHVLVNRCVHRGSVVCREARGHAVRFVCPYHGWAYEISGKLTGITDRSVAGGYAQDFDAPEGLYRVPRVEVYRGFIFASFDPDVPPLLEHLGKAKDLIDLKLDMSPVGEIRLRSIPYVVRYQGNWKFQAENIVDQYHFMFVHSPFARLQAATPPATSVCTRADRTPRCATFATRAQRGDANTAMGSRSNPRATRQACSAGNLPNSMPGFAIGTEKMALLALAAKAQGRSSPTSASSIIRYALGVRWRRISPK
jgi:phenylpropionate dioxygenase-like ring-hydroxylating dioxygenase large terminal subunit/NAD(P)-dependent dehydrogenase (short-subunit alcohol dehydrogenase family)